MASDYPEADIQTEDYYNSDDEIFIGPITLKEVKKILLPQSRETVGFVSTMNGSDKNNSLKLIETHSAPNISPKIYLDSPFNKSDFSPKLSHVASDWDLKPDDSFLQLEKMVSDLCMMPKSQENEVVSTALSTKKCLLNSEFQELNMNVDKLANENAEQCCEYKTPLKKYNMNVETLDVPHEDIFTTPSSELKTRTPIFKTPGITVSQKKKIMLPSKKYQHVVSPVASYIKTGLREVFPKKTPGVSYIPKPVNNSLRPNAILKENVKQNNVKQKSKLSVACKSAKEKLTDISVEGNHIKS